MKIGDHVHDSSNPIALGVVMKMTKNRTRVWFASGVANAYTAVYDKAHRRFLLVERSV